MLEAFLLQQALNLGAGIYRLGLLCVDWLMLPLLGTVGTGCSHLFHQQLPYTNYVVSEVAPHAAVAPIICPSLSLEGFKHQAGVLT